MKQNPRDIIIRPIITEKTIREQHENNKVTFEVSKKANKVAIRKAVEEIFDVKVEKVNVINVASKKKRMGLHEGKTRSYKKAIVKLAEGSEINIL